MLNIYKYKTCIYLELPTPKILSTPKINWCLDPEKDCHMRESKKDGKYGIGVANNFLILFGNSKEINCGFQIK